jgi:hypothetical protein
MKALSKKQIESIKPPQAYVDKKLMEELQWEK